ncbi:thiamine-phosphate kinase [Thermasporomyces composti]|uniref:Thiamine-monophosphate kinase n=1 Tax=Thermasporomyces composti TaxID=696763 RepID=A0A3D9VD52_THECX|nr:thiamine-phosphate kinase [Thermasporomyces composti]REF35231.1 thiamine-phosphate kinase [Thermasporomyces composti]
MTGTQRTPTRAGEGQTLADVGEFGLIDLIRERLRDAPQVELGAGDDAAVVAASDGRMVVTTDMLVEGRHFRRDWSSAYDVGRKAAAQNLADVAAMGATPTAVVVCFGAPPDLPVAWAVEFADGLRDECQEVGAAVAGGDVVASGVVVAAVTAMGSLQGRAAVTRSGARPGDQVAVCGRLGWSAAGLTVLSRGFRSPRVLVEAHRRPQPPYAAGPEAACLGATALIDVSDGLLADLGHIAVASGVAIDLDSSRFDLPEPIQAVAAAVGAEPLSYVLTGGEDHALAGTFPADVSLPPHWNVVGRVLEGEPAVTVDGAAYEGPAGHDHFG